MEGLNQVISKGNVKGIVVKILIDFDCGNKDYKELLVNIWKRKKLFVIGIIFFFFE